MTIGDVPLKIVYDTTLLAGSPAAVFGSGPPSGSFGALWQLNIQKSLTLQSDAGAGAAYSGVVMRRGGSALATASVAGFDSCTQGASGGGGSAYVSSVQPELKLNYVGQSGQLVDAKQRTFEQYDASGMATVVASAQGGSLNLSYSDATTPGSVAPAPGLLIAVSDAVGRKVQFTYEQPAAASLAPRVATVTTPNGTVIQAAYDGAGNLLSLTWPDGRVHSLRYERPDLPWALTGIVDEAGARHSTYGYDAQGRAITTELAGSVNRFAVSYAASGPQWSVTEIPMGDFICREHRWVAPSGIISVSKPTGAVSDLTAAATAGTIGLTTQSQPAGSGCGASSTAQSYDSKGNVSQFDDVKGNRTCFAYDLSRGLRVVTLEGLSPASACPADVSSYALAAGAVQRKTSTQWHPDWDLQAKIAEPGRITTYVYNGQPDPFNANAVASCAPATALLPDGKPIAVLCRQVEQATTDANGALGFAATLQAGVANREQKWTYNERGQVLTHDGPRTDVVDTTTYAYYTDTVFTGVDPNAVGHTIGDLKTVTNGKGQVTQYTKYDKHGNVLESIDPNGVVSSYVYDLRQRLLSATVGGQTTSYTYDPVGQLTRVTLPDTSWIGYEYDDAHRQKAVLDSRGNRIDYVLDNAGNRTGETVKDLGGALKRQLARSIDALGRVQQTTGRN